MPFQRTWRRFLPIALDYFLLQYEQLMKVFAQHKAGTLSPQEAEGASVWGPSRQIARASSRKGSYPETRRCDFGQEVRNATAHQMFVCAKSMVDTYALSDQTFAFPSIRE